MVTVLQLQSDDVDVYFNSLETKALKMISELGMLSTPRQLLE